MAALPSNSPGSDFAREALPHLGAVTGFARWLTGNDADAEDLTQETYLRACRGWGGFEPGTSCRAWLFTICRNLHYNTRQRDARSVPATDPVLDALAAAAFSTPHLQAGQAHVFDSFDLRDAIQREIDRLPVAIREVIVLVDLEGWSYEDTARALSRPIGTVRSRLFRGRRVLQERLLLYARDVGLAGSLPHAAKE